METWEFHQFWLGHISLLRPQHLTKPIGCSSPSRQHPYGSRSSNRSLSKENRGFEVATMSFWWQFFPISFKSHLEVLTKLVGLIEMYMSVKFYNHRRRSERWHIDPTWSHLWRCVVAHLTLLGRHFRPSNYVCQYERIGIFGIKRFYRLIDDQIFTHFGSFDLWW